jgi:hypothetical protein
MKKVALFVRQAEISRVFPSGLQLMLEDDASAFDAIKAADEEIEKKMRDLSSEEIWKLTANGLSSL